MIKILFVCHGNICRSPAAEFIMKRLVRKKGKEAAFEIASAGVSDEECWRGRGNPVYPPMLEELQKHGLSADGKYARQIRREDYDHYDYLIGMDGGNLRGMERCFGGDPEGKLHRLLDFTDTPRDVADPWYSRDFQKAYEDIEEGCIALLQNLECVKRDGSFQHS
ncbi:MAG: low molecular weight phosphotyrosine protein phosphatase [Lachnospiraceae bacterium]|nr:low molecular weight phosphotyrosine protein phosphatase [Lachnospiraceae bacterium]